jgi:hypothetical protein
MNLVSLGARRSTHLPKNRFNSEGVCAAYVLTWYAYGSFNHECLDGYITVTKFCINPGHNSS